VVFREILLFRTSDPDLATDARARGGAIQFGLHELLQKPSSSNHLDGSADSVTSMVTLESEIRANPNAIEDPQLSRLLSLFSSANVGQRSAILTVAETIVGSGKIR
jgi:hypothetical protein